MSFLERGLQKLRGIWRPGLPVEGPRPTGRATAKKSDDSEKICLLEPLAKVMATMHAPEGDSHASCLGPPGQLRTFWPAPQHPSRDREAAERKTLRLSVARSSW